MSEERDWKKFGYGIVLRICAAPTMEKLQNLLTLHADNLEGYKAWNPVKHQQLMELVSEKRAELFKQQ